MIPAGIPLDEHERLGHLRALAILDTPPEERFDRITRMARRLFGVPIALISMVDENRQWFKSCNGLDVMETDRKISFCGHAILQKNTLVIEDALNDERFFDNPLVTESPHIRFYAGQPLRIHSGHAMGTLCIIDHQPRQFSDDDHALLVDLAQMVEREIIAIQLSGLDELTRISNRRGFLTISRYSLEVCKRQKLPAVLVFFDLDKFKQINDTHGHAAGDNALQTFADQLRESFRSSDVCARLGGDEFVALLTDTTDTAIQNLIARFEDALQVRCSNAGLPYKLEFSYGMVAYDPARHVSAEDLLKAADVAMYTQKASKRSKP